MHCQKELLIEKILCQECFAALKFLQKEGRCLHCFLIKGYECTCYEKKPMHPIIGTLAPFSYEGPAKSLIKQFKFGDTPFLAKTLASLMTSYYLLLNRPLPDIITTIPLPFLRKMERGYNQSELLAREVARYLSCPYYPLLSTYWYNSPSTTLSLQERQERENPFFIKRFPKNITRKTLLIIDDVITTGTTLKLAALALQELNPLKLYALAFCRSE